MQIRIANENDVESLRRLYRELEADGVKYQPEHFVVGYRSVVLSAGYTGERFLLSPRCSTGYAYEPARAKRKRSCEQLGRAGALHNHLPIW